MKENKFQTRLVEMLRSRGAKVLNVHGHMLQQAGWPDLFISHWDFTGWIELKVDDRPASTLQKICVKDLRLRRTKAFFLRYDNSDQTVSLDEVKTLCWKFSAFSKENVIETLNFMWEQVSNIKSVNEDDEFERLISEGSEDENYRI